MLKCKVIFIVIWDDPHESNRDSSKVFTIEKRVFYSHIEQIQQELQMCNVRNSNLFFIIIRMNNPGNNQWKILSHKRYCKVVASRCYLKISMGFLKIKVLLTHWLWSKIIIVIAVWTLPV